MRWRGRRGWRAATPTTGTSERPACPPTGPPGTAAEVQWSLYPRYRDRKVDALVMSFQKFMAQPLVLGAMVVSLLFGGALMAIPVAVILIGGWAISSRLRRDDPTRT